MDIKLLLVARNDETFLQQLSELGKESSWLKDKLISFKQTDDWKQLGKDLIELKEKFKKLSLGQLNSPISVKLLFWSEICSICCKFQNDGGNDVNLLLSKYTFDSFEFSSKQSGTSFSLLNEIFKNIKFVNDFTNFQKIAVIFF